MEPTEGYFRSPVDGTRLATYEWGAAIDRPRGAVQLAHAITEHGRRYAGLARTLAAAGYRVYGMDLRGHGRSVAGPEQFGDFGAAGFAGLVGDMADYGRYLTSREQHVPLFLLGQSMGSYAAQHVLLDHSARYAGAILAGSAALDVLAANVDVGGQLAGGPLSYNHGFAHRTGFEWLSRDAAEVDRLLADPLAAFALPEGALLQMVDGADRLADPGELLRIRSDLPILLISGRDDPLSGDGQLVALLAQRYRTAGVMDVTVRIYPGARHQIFMETNREEVYDDVRTWLDAHAPPAGSGAQHSGA